MNGLLLESPLLDVFAQMAVDEALARSRPEEFCLRFFRWKGVGATFGYAQRIREVEKALPPGVETSFTRRPTGGGIVPHFNDLTFSCIYPDKGVLSPAIHYQRLHSAIQAALCEAGWEARLSDSEGGHAPHGPEGASRCFEKPVALDVLSGNSKILGGAIRRYGNTVLYQGSLQIPGVRDRAPELEELIQRHLGAEWGLQWTAQALADSIQAEASTLENRYRSAEWIRKI